ncbi:MAG TPA: helix-turn-helix domain-containing protein [Rhodospirillales bacterium]|nr:helix-turn-helix domain-containing protein [Rhodospirillales bacterium]HIO82098.1 helix-turn-helix domain-containing protein [Candidatus Poribacteria bacterium]
MIWLGTFLTQGKCTINYKQLSQEEIAGWLKRSPSTISRQIKRNQGLKDQRND